MPNELSPKQQSALDLIQNHKPGELVEPLKKTIFLFDTFISGTSHLEHPEVLETLKPDTILRMIREDNPYDENAIRLETSAHEKVGYIPQKDNIVFARLMDEGKFLQAKVRTSQNKGHYWLINIGIEMVDF